MEGKVPALKIEASRLPLLGIAGVVVALAVPTAAAERIDMLKKLHLPTVLVQEGAPRAVIVRPRDEAGGLAAAHLAAQLKARTGAELPLVSDGEGWDQEWGQRNLIVVGNLMTNTVAERLYCLHYACSDAAWPGKDGYELRTISNPRGIGHNVLFLGGSDAEGVRAAVEAFLKHVPSGPNLILDPLIETRIDGQTFAPLTAEAFQSSLQAPQSPVGYATQYWRTGNPQYAELARAAYLRFADQMETQGTIAYTSGYDWYGLGWDLVEEASIFSDEDRRVITNALITFMEKSPSTYGPIQPQKRPFHGVDMNTIHIYDTARYFQDYYPDCEVAQKIMAREEVYWSVQEQHWKQDCQASGYQMGDGANLLLYCLQSLDFDWLESGNFRRWLEFMVLSHINDGGMSGYGDSGWGGGGQSLAYVAQVGAWYYREGWMQWVADRNGSPRSGFNLGHTFYPGDVEPEPPMHLGDLAVAPLADWMYEMVETEAARSRTFDKVAVQDGYQPRAPYLLLDGTGSYPHGHPATNQIVCFASGGRVWLFPSGYMIHQIAEHNLVAVYRDGRGPEPMPPLAELRQSRSLPGGKFLESVLPGYNGVDWSRCLFWQPGGTVLVLDRLTARRTGDYGFQCVWRCDPEEIDAEHRSVTVPAREGTFRLWNADPSTLGIKDCVYEPHTALYESANVRLEAGQTYTFRNLFYATPPGEDRTVQLRTVGDAALIIAEGGAHSLAGLGPCKEDPLQIDAAQFWVSPTRISLVEARLFTAGDWKLEADPPASWDLDLEDGILTFQAAEPTRIRVHRLGAVTRLEIPAGTSEHRLAEWGLRGPGNLEASLDRVWAQADPVIPARPKTAGPEAPLAMHWQIPDFAPLCVEPAPAPGANPGNRVVRTQDLDGDGVQEILVGRTDHRLYCLSADGQLRWIFQAPNEIQDIFADDVDGDGQPEVVFVCSRVAAGGTNSYLFLLNSDGTERWRVACPPGYWRWEYEGYAEPHSRGEPGAMLLCFAEDFNGDGQKEIIAAAYNFFIYCFDVQGQELWEVMNYAHRPVAWKLADFDGDGKNEFAIATSYYETNVYRGNGQQMFGSRIPGPGLDVADLTGEGRLSIINGSRLGPVAVTEYDPRASVQATTKPPAVWRPKGGKEDFAEVRPGLYVPDPEWQFNTGAIVDVVQAVDLFGEGRKQILAGSRNMHLYCFDPTGEVRWARGLGEMVRCLVAQDLDGDGTKEILVGCDDGRIYSLNPHGEVSGTYHCGSGVRSLQTVRLRPDGPWEVLVSTWEGALMVLRWTAKPARSGGAGETPADQREP